MPNHPSIHRIVALAVLSLLATGLHGGFSVVPFTWPHEDAYAVTFSMFFQDEDGAPGQPLALQAAGVALGRRATAGYCHSAREPVPDRFSR